MTFRNDYDELAGSLDAMKVGDAVVFEHRSGILETKIAKVGRLWVTTECGRRFSISSGHSGGDHNYSRAFRDRRALERCRKRETMKARAMRITPGDLRYIDDTKLATLMQWLEEPT